MRDIRLGFFVIGAMKAGTTSVYKYLSANDAIYMPPEKEAPFFSDDAAYSRGIGWYMDNFFGDVRHETTLGTVTPLYMMIPSVPGRISESCPDAKLIAILRDPIERAYSHYHMATRFQGEDRTFECVVTQQLDSKNLLVARQQPNYWRDYVIFGEYGRILSEFRVFFPEDQLLILFMDELTLDPKSFMAKIFAFLDLPNVDVPNLGQKYHESSSSPVKTLLANVIFNTRFRAFGKILPARIRRNARFWMGIHRRLPVGDLDNSFRLTRLARNKLEQHYRGDASLLKELTKTTPYWISNWDPERSRL